jgi:predicted CoA-binding protein
MANANSAGDACAFTPEMEPGAYDRLRILTRYRRIAMVGLSPNPYRPSHFAAIYLKSNGYRIIPVNPQCTDILGETCYPDLRSIPEPVDIVDIFRKPQDVPAIVDDAIAIGAKVIWMQLGVVNELAAAKARAHGLEVVMDRCTKIEHARFFGGLHIIGLNTGVVSSRRHLL